MIGDDRHKENRRCLPSHSKPGRMALKASRSAPFCGRVRVLCVLPGALASQEIRESDEHIAHEPSATRNKHDEEHRKPTKLRA